VACLVQLNEVRRGRVALGDADVEFRALNEVAVSQPHVVGQFGSLPVENLMKRERVLEIGGGGVLEELKCI
jgi:hypothetical protein